MDKNFLNRTSVNKKVKKLMSKSREIKRYKSHIKIKQYYCIWNFHAVALFLEHLNIPKTKIQGSYEGGRTCSLESRSNGMQGEKSLVLGSMLRNPLNTVKNWNKETQLSCLISHMEACWKFIWLLIKLIFQRLLSLPGSYMDEVSWLNFASLF